MYEAAGEFNEFGNYNSSLDFYYIKNQFSCHINSVTYEN